MLIMWRKRGEAPGHGATTVPSSSEILFGTSDKTTRRALVHDLALASVATLVHYWAYIEKRVKTFPLFTSTPIFPQCLPSVLPAYAGTAAIPWWGIFQNARKNRGASTQTQTRQDTVYRDQSRPPRNHYFTRIVPRPEAVSAASFHSQPKRSACLLPPPPLSPPSRLVTKTSFAPGTVQ